MSNTKNLTIALDKEVQGELDVLVEYFQKDSISNVTKSDVIKYLIKSMKDVIEKDKLTEFRRILNEGVE